MWEDCPGLRWTWRDVQDCPQIQHFHLSWDTGGPVRAPFATPRPVLPYHRKKAQEGIQKGKNRQASKRQFQNLTEVSDLVTSFYKWGPFSFLSTKLKEDLSSASWLLRRRQWHPTPVLLLGKSHGRRSLVGYSPWGRKELDTTERVHTCIYLLFCKWSYIFH